MYIESEDRVLAMLTKAMIEDKSQTIEEIKNGTVKYSAIDVTEENLRMYGNHRDIQRRGNVKMTLNGQPLTADVRVTIVWVKQNGQWKRVSFQATQVQTASGS